MVTPNMSDTMIHDADALAMLMWLHDMAASDAVRETPQNRFVAIAEAADAPALERVAVDESAAKPAAPIRSAPASRVAPLTDDDMLAVARARAAEATTLDALKAAIAGFEGSALKASARNLVFADGNPAAPLMIVGEAPGRDEDAAGLPFVGASGQLLDRILGAAGLDRTKVYITNLLPWRPPENREPSLTEAAMFLPFLKRHIALVRPRVVLALGASSMRHLFNVSEGITRMRGKWVTLSIEGQQIPALATFHPAALLRNALNKRYVWRDMLTVTDRLAELAAE